MYNLESIRLIEQAVVRFIGDSELYDICLGHVHCLSVIINLKKMYI